MPLPSRRWSVLVASALSLAAASGCSSTSESSPAADAGLDAALDASADSNAPIDSMPEAPLDAELDAELDAQPDAAADAQPDAAADAPFEGGTAVTTALPKRPATSATGGATKWFAMTLMRLGTLTPIGIPMTTAWQHYGMNLDGRVTTAADSVSETATCKRPEGAAGASLEDGLTGIDNNFGSRILPMVRSLKSDVEDATNNSIFTGQFTLLLRLDNVGPDDNANVPGSLYLAGPLGSSPTFSELDVWPIDARSMDGSSPKTTFPNGYMAGGVWVSGDSGADEGQVPVVGFLGVTSFLRLAPLLITFDAKTGNDGAIAGASRSEDLVAWIDVFLRSFAICPGPTRDAVLATITRSSDLVSSAVGLQDESKTCDATSVGLGFIARPTGAPTETVTQPPPPDECD